MMWNIQNKCIVCHLYFCCAVCRWIHEQTIHSLTYDCPICRGQKYLCRPEGLTIEFKKHLSKEHLPLNCNKCNKTFDNMDDLPGDKCTSFSDITAENFTNDNINEIDNRFDSIYKLLPKTPKDNLKGLPLVNKISKTAVISPNVHKNHLVDYESSDTEVENSPMKVSSTPYVRLYQPKTPKNKRAATPHVKKLKRLIRQKTIELEYDETANELFNGSPDGNTTTLSGRDDIEVLEKHSEVSTPTSFASNILKVAQIVSTSTPTHPAVGAWSLFSDPGADSPLSEIENPESPAETNIEPSKHSEVMPPKLKSIIVNSSKPRLGSQDSSEKQVTFLDSDNNTENSSAKAKKVKFAEDTIFEPDNKLKRIYRKPRRMLTPGPQKQRYCFNPRFQALVNRFENQGITMARTAHTPVSTREAEVPEEVTPQAIEHNLPARAINFKDDKEDSPALNIDTRSIESTNELFKTCIESPESSVDNALTAFTANIADSLQSCLKTILNSQNEDTELQFKFVVSKKCVSVRRLPEDQERREIGSGEHKENIWSTVTKAVKSVLWGQQGCLEPTTPYKSMDSNDTTSSSASKRKFDDISDIESPLNHKRQKYEARIKGRPPIHRHWNLKVAALKAANSAETPSLKNMFFGNDTQNSSF